MLQEATSRLAARSLLYPFLETFGGRGFLERWLPTPASYIFPPRAGCLSFPFPKRVRGGSCLEKGAV